MLLTGLRCPYGIIPPLLQPQGWSILFQRCPYGIIPLLSQPQGWSMLLLSWFGHFLTWSFWIISPFELQNFSAYSLPWWLISIDFNRIQATLASLMFGPSQLLVVINKPYKGPLDPETTFPTSKGTCPLGPLRPHLSFCQYFYLSWQLRWPTWPPFQPMVGLLLYQSYFDPPKGPHLSSFAWYFSVIWLRTHPDPLRVTIPNFLAWPKVLRNHFFQTF